jgi:hypothetical protein
MTIEAASQDIRERAYALWEARGRQHGLAEKDWRDAEGQIKAELDAVSSSLEPLAQAAADALEDEE